MPFSNLRKLQRGARQPQGDKVRVTLPSAPDEIVTFFFPGAFGGPMEWLNVTAVFRKKNANWPIYLYYDPAYAPTESSSIDEKIQMGSSFEAHITFLAQQMGFYSLEGKSPIMVMGFSYGAFFGKLVADKFKQLYPQSQVHFFPIDATAPDISKNDLVGNNVSVIKDLVTIFNHAAKLGDIHPAEFDSNEIESIYKLKFTIPKENLLGERINAITTKIWENTLKKWEIFSHAAQTSIISRDSFDFLVQIAERNLNNIAKYQSQESDQKLDTITALITKNTIQKYGVGEDGGWKKFTHENMFTAITDSDLLELEHLNLLSKGAEKLASAFHMAINSNTTILDSVLQVQAHGFNKALKRRIAANTEKEKNTTTPSRSSSDSDLKLVELTSDESSSGNESSPDNSSENRKSLKVTSHLSSGSESDEAGDTISVDEDNGKGKIEDNGKGKIINEGYNQIHGVFSKFEQVGFFSKFGSPKQQKYLADQSQLNNSRPSGIVIPSLTLTKVPQS